MYIDVIFCSLFTNNAVKTSGENELEAMKILKEVLLEVVSKYFCELCFV